jgi:hypothetical protein
VNSAILLPKLEQKFKFIVANLKEVCVSAFFGTKASGGLATLRFF